MTGLAGLNAAGLPVGFPDTASNCIPVYSLPETAGRCTDQNLVRTIPGNRVPHEIDLEGV